MRALAPAWCHSSWLTSREPREVGPALISLLLVSQPGEAAPEEVLCRSPLGLMSTLPDHPSLSPSVVASPIYRGPGPLPKY